MKSVKRLALLGVFGINLISIPLMNAQTDFDVKNLRFEVNSSHTTTNETMGKERVLIPPPNDMCTGAIMLPVGSSLSVCSSPTYTTIAATQSLPGGSCNSVSGASDDDVFFSFVATSAMQGINVYPLNDSFDAVVDVWDDCIGSNSLGCVDAGLSGTTESLILNGLNVGSTYYIRVYTAGLSFEGDFYLCVYNLYPVNLGVKKINVEYTIIPDFQVPSLGIPLHAIVENIGTTDQVTNVTADIYQLPNTTVPVQGFNSASVSINSMSEMNIHVGNFMPSAVGEYRIVYSINSVGDGDLQNNYDTTNIEISPDIYARDDANTPYGVGFAGDGEIVLAQSFDIYSPTQILSVEYNITSGGAGDTIQALVYDVDMNGQPNNIIAQSAITTLSSGGIGLVNLPISPVLTINTPGEYLVGLSHKARGVGLGLGISSNNYTPRTSWANVMNSYWYNTEDVGLEVAYSIRPTLKQVVGIVGENFESFEIYPNPTEGLFTLNYALKKSSDVKVEVMDISGRVVASFSEKTEAAKHSIDLSEVAAGVYTVRFSVDGEATFHKLVVR